MAVKGAKTINEYKLRKWTEENFQEGTVTFCLSQSADQAVLVDKKGQEMTIGINPLGKVEAINYGIQFQLLGKEKMVALMKSQLETAIDTDTRNSNFDYKKFDQNSEQLTYRDNQDNLHNMYHSVVGGKEVCLYNINNGRNRAIAVQKDSIVEKLSKFSRDINNGKEDAQSLNVNNLEHQRDSKER